jgi:hypothetical protein
MNEPKLQPGVQVTPEQKRQLAEFNAKESADAQRLAADHIARDRAEGKGDPAVKSVADMLKDKLLKGDIRPPEEGTRSHTK